MRCCRLCHERRWITQEMREVLRRGFRIWRTDYGGYYGYTVDGLWGRVDRCRSEKLVGDPLDVGGVDAADAYCLDLLL